MNCQFNRASNYINEFENINTIKILIIKLIIKIIGYFNHHFDYVSFSRNN